MTDQEFYETISEELFEHYSSSNAAIKAKNYTKAIDILEPIFMDFIEKGVTDPLPTSITSFFSRISTDKSDHVKWVIDIRLLTCLNLIKAYIEIKEEHKAMKILEFIIYIWPDYSPAYRELGKLYFKQNNFKEAYRHLKNSLLHGDTDLSIYPILTFLCNQLDLYEEAVMYGEKSLQLRLMESSIYQDLILAYNETGQKEKLSNLFSFLKSSEKEKV